MKVQSASRLVLCGLFVLSVMRFLTLSPPAAQAQEGGTTAGVPGSAAIATTTLAPSYATKGRVAVAGTGMRGVGAGTLTIAGIPAGAKIKAAFLYWSVVDNAAPSSDAGLLDDTSITGTLLGSGPSPCWPQAATHGFRADVKSIVTARTDPNGAYALAGFPDSGDFSTAPSTEGATLVIVWKKKGELKRLVLINDGLDVTTTAGQIVSTTFTFAKNGKLFQAKAPVDAIFTVAGGDGQSPPPTFADFTLFNGTTVGTDNWDASDGDMQDTDQFDVSALVAAGDTSATGAIGMPASGGDCIAWTTAILEVTAKKAP
jgi:hypothetical protein